MTSSMLVITAADAASLPTAAIEILETEREYGPAELTIPMLRSAGAVECATRAEARSYLAGREGYVIDDDGCTSWIRAR